MPTPELAEIPVRSAEALTLRWVQLLDPPAFRIRSLWLTWFAADGRQLPMLVPVDDVPARPPRTTLASLLQVHELVVSERLGGDGHLAMALCRPGPAEPTDDDLAWADGFRELLRDPRPGAGSDRTTWSLHLATASGVQALAGAPETVS